MKSYKVALKTRHFEALAQLAKSTSPEHFKNNDFFEIGQSLYRRLRPLETRAHYNAELLCGTEHGYIEQDEYEKRQERVAEQVKRLFGGNLPAGFFINGDPRGYALKINAGNEAGMTYHPEYIPAGLHTDWGGYGILAPEEF